MDVVTCEKKKKLLVTGQSPGKHGKNAIKNTTICTRKDNPFSFAEDVNVEEIWA